MDAVVIRAPLIGRVSDCRAISQAVERAIAFSRPQLVTILGNPGVGKTRVVTEVLADLRETHPGLRPYRAACRPDSGLQGAIARILRARFGILETQPPSEQVQQLHVRLSELFGEQRVGEMVDFIGAAMGLPVAKTALGELYDEDAATRAALARAVLRKLFEVDAHRAPLVLVIEDLHRARKEGAQFLRALFESMSNAPIVLVVTASPELLAKDRDWPTLLGERHVRIDLGPLSDEESHAMARALLNRVRDSLGEVPIELIDAAVDMAGGSPMLLEQIVRIYFAEDVVGFREDGSVWVDIDKLAELELPMSVEDAVRSRLSVLAPAERVLLEKGAVMGPVFWLGGLVVLGRAAQPAPDLWGGTEDIAYQYRDLLASLEAKDYVLRMPESSISGDEEYIFKHNLEREMLRGLVAVETAHDYHLLLAEWLEFRLLERSEEQLDLLAEHYELGERPLRAARCVLESADRSRERFANAKAAESYRRGLSLLGDFDVRLKLEAHHHLGDVLQRLGQTDAALESFGSMQQIAFRLDLRSKGGAAHNRIGRVFREIGQLDDAMRHLGTALALFEAAGDARGIASSFDDIGKVHWLRGSYAQALRFLRDALVRRESLGDRRSIALSLHNIGSVLQDSGQYLEGLVALTKALEIRREIMDLQGIVLTLNNLGTIHQDQGKTDVALAVWTEALTYAREAGDRRREALLLVNIGEAHYRLRKPGEAIALLLNAETMCGEIDDRMLLAEVWRGLGTAHLLQSNVEVAQSYLERSVQLFDQVRSRIHAAIARRSLAECLALGGRNSDRGRQAEALFREALAVFESVNNEVEWARTARAFGAFLSDSVGVSDTDLGESGKLIHTANEIRAKLNLSLAGIDPGPIFHNESHREHVPHDAIATSSSDPAFDGGLMQTSTAAPIVRLTMDPMSQATLQTLTVEEPDPLHTNRERKP
ncbi:MAG: tetratricopeptide repeat protein [Deltaproteobacteria bacterium]|nr:tetratricopeptide repeat protein [Deltaproteobacteria bacterium]